MKKATPKIIHKKDTRTERPAAGISLSARDFFPALLIIGYVVVDFIPGNRTADVMGNQWLYLSFVNLATILFNWFDKRADNPPGFRRIAGSALSLIYFGLFLLAGLSIAFAINKTESLVCYARLVNSLAMYLGLAILLYGRMHLLRGLALLLSLILLVQSLDVITEFLSRSGDTDISTLIYSLKGNAANKNILAASLVVKLPFAVYWLCSSKTWGKMVAGLIILSATLAVFILNARSAFLGIIAELLVFIIVYLFSPSGQTNRLKAYNIGMVVTPVVISFFVSIAIIKKAVSAQDEKTPYGTVMERLGSISLTSEGSNARISLWANAFNYIRNHPLKGAGYGNWKLASIPYEKTFVDDLLVSYHVHNDFLEISAETGVVGGLLFISIFVCVMIYAWKTLFVKNKKQDTAILFALMGMAGYAADAMFNFPMERPIMQFLFATWMAIAVNSYLASKEETKEENSGPVAFKGIIAVASLLLLLPALYINLQTSKSLIAQTKVNRDMLSPNPVTTWAEISDAFPSIPNINMYCFPIGQVKAFYLLKEKNYDEALKLINKSTAANPYMTFAEYLKARIFKETNRLDSAFLYAHRAFYTKPRARSHYEMLNDISILRNDTSSLTAAFREYIKYRNEAWAWNRYLGIMFSLQKDRSSLLALADSATRLFPGDTALQQKKEQLGNPQTNVPISKTQDDAFRNYFATGLAAFNEKKYNIALDNFKLAAAANPSDYVAVENMGVCYFSMGNYSKAIPYFDQVLSRKISVDGKSEFLKGVSLLNLTKKDQGCQYITQAANKNYPGAKDYMLANCK